jgi:hypothetical protein
MTCRMLRVRTARRQPRGAFHDFPARPELGPALRGVHARARAEIDRRA